MNRRGFLKLAAGATVATAAGCKGLEIAQDAIEEAVITKSAAPAVTHTSAAFDVELWSELIMEDFKKNLVMAQLETRPGYQKKGESRT
jgi:hypothetical protein